MITPTVTWNADADGRWGTHADWSPTRLPGAADVVAIDTADFHTITHGTGSDTVNRPTMGADTFEISRGLTP